MAAEAMDRSEHAQEDLLRQIERFVAIAQKIDGQLHHHPLMLADQFGARALVTRCTSLHE